MEAASVVAAPFWTTIAGKTDLEDKNKHTFLRTVFSEFTNYRTVFYCSSVLTAG